MAADELEVLARAHGLFAGTAVMPGNGAVAEVRSGFSAPPGVMATAYRRAVAQRSAEAAAVLRIDDDLIRILASAVREHGRSRLATAAVLAAARADGDWPDNPIAAREALRRKALRLRAQRRHVLEARRRAHRGRAELLALRYRGRSHRRGGGAGRRIERVVRAALSRLGCPYVWGATGPDRFDCSGLVKWAYAQAGIGLPAPPTTRSTRGCRYRANRSAPAIWCFRTPATCRWRSDPTRSSRRRTPVPRCESVRSDRMLRSGGCCSGSVGVHGVGGG